MSRSEGESFAVQRRVTTDQKWQTADVFDTYDEAWTFYLGLLDNPGGFHYFRLITCVVTQAETR